MSYAMRGLGLPAPVDPDNWYVDETSFWADEHDGQIYKGYSAHPQPTLPDSPTITQWCRATEGPHFTRGPFDYGPEEDKTYAIDLYAGELPPEIMASQNAPLLPPFEPFACKKPMSVMQMSLIAAGGLAAVAAILYVSRKPR